MNEPYEPKPEVWALLDAACANALTAGQVADLEAALQADARLRDFYLDYFRLHAELCRSTRLERSRDNVLDAIRQGENDECGMMNDELPADAACADVHHSSFIIHHSESPAPSPDSLTPPVIIDTSSALFPPLSAFGSSLGGWLFSYAAATVIVGMAILGAWAYRVSLDSELVREQPRPAPRGIDVTPEFVGRITGMADCRWADPQDAPSAAVPLGRKYALRSGLMEISYDSGARVILQGPCTYEVESAAAGFLSLGKLTARVEKSEIRNPKSESSDPSSLIPHPSPLFAVRTPTAVVTDLGTEFGVEVDRHGQTRSHVFRGAISVKPTAASAGSPQAGPVTVRASQSLLVESRGGEATGRHTSVSWKPAEPAHFVRTMPNKPLPVSVPAYFRLGEDDPGAVAGKPVGKETLNHVSRWHLTKYGSPSYTADTAAPGSSLAVNFTGAPRECLYCDELFQSPIDDFILEAWVRLNRPARWPTYLVYNGRPNTDGYGVLLGEDGWYVMLSTIILKKLDVPCEVGKWTHVALVCEQGKWQFWLNGRLAKNLSGIRGPKMPHGPFCVGGAPESAAAVAYSIDGQIDEVRLSEFRGPFRPEMLLWPEARQSAATTNNDDPTKKGEVADGRESRD